MDCVALVVVEVIDNATVRYVWVLEWVKAMGSIDVIDGEALYEIGFVGTIKQMKLDYTVELRSVHMHGRWSIDR